MFDYPVEEEFEAQPPGEERAEEDAVLVGGGRRQYGRHDDAVVGAQFDARLVQERADRVEHGVEPDGRRLEPFEGADGPFGVVDDGLVDAQRLGHGQASFRHRRRHLLRHIIQR